MRTILVDDEQGARGHLADLLAHQDEIEVVAQADHPLLAIDVINKLAPELVFLDIQMPLLDGFEMLPYLTCRPIIIFCTAHDSYAIRAFEVNALDYLLKPVTPERLTMALERAANEWARLQSINTMEPRPGGLRKIICQQGGSNRVIWLREINLFQKEGRYTSVWTTAGDHYLTELTLDYLEKKITVPHFFRINRGVLLRKDQIRDYGAQSYGSGELTTHDNQSFTISRSRFPAFKSWLGEPS